jgi:D-glycero-alpha-D-manno-heptose 1-phosphate guanylyltransferase
VSKENYDIIILAGGLGTRLRSVVHDTPKCLAPVAGKPFLHFLLQYLAKQNITKHVILSVGYLHNQIEDYIESVKQQYVFDFEFVLEDEPLGTGGGIQLALKAAQTKNALILNGDTFYNADLNKFIEHHHAKEAHTSLALKPLTNFDRYGTVQLSDEGIITTFNEKKAVSEGLINGGIYAVNVTEFLELNMPEKFSFEQEYLSKTASYNHKLCGSIDDGYFIDIGVPTDFEIAQTSLKEIYG